MTYTKFVSHANGTKILFEIILNIKKEETIMHNEIKSLIEKIKQHSEMSYSLAKSQYELLLQTKASAKDFQDFKNDLKGSLAVFQ